MPNFSRGDARKTTKLNPEQRASIRRLHAAGVTRKALAERFDVSRPTIDKAINEKPPNEPTT